ncbi:MAG: DUF11 domain-containing protein [Candidatus Saccharimonadales bacterium]
MFRKLVSGLPFSPALVGSLGFYARRLKREEATRRLGLIFTALALVVQSFAVFSPPEPANAASSNDMIYGGIDSRADILHAYDTNSPFRNVMKYAGITRSELSTTQLKSINNLSYGTGANAWKSWGYNSKFSSAQGEVKHSAFGTTVYSRPHLLYNTTTYQKTYGQTVQVFYGKSAALGEFGIMVDCGNLFGPKLPLPPPPPPAPTATCSNLDAVKISYNRYRFKASATVTGGATISSYQIVVRNASNVIVKTITHPSTSTSIDIPTEYTFTPGTYSAVATVTTSVGTKTSSGCAESFTVPTPPTPASPSITIDKKVDGVELKTVNVNQEFVYQLVVKNTGNVALANVKVTDPAPKGVTLIKASQGTISSNVWSHTVASLGIGQSLTYTITAKVPVYVAGQLNNNACVDTSTVTGTNPDDCDDAVVELPVPEIKVCELSTFKIITIKEPAFNSNLHSKNLADCTRLQVCELSSNTVITIRETAFDATKHSKTLTDCENIQVCDLTTGQVITIAQNDFNANKHSKEPYDCQSSVVLTKSSTNLTQNTDATKVTAEAGDRITFTLTAENAGKVLANVDFSENVTDTLEYSTLNDNGGAAKTTTAADGSVLSWGMMSLKPGDKVTRTFTVKVLDEIPATARGISEPSSFDCIMTNTFGNALSINVDCNTPKVLEATIQELPSTGPGENMLFAGVLGSVVTFFYARSRQLSKEVRLIRKDFNAGTL